MNKQDLVREYEDYGYSVEEIAKELNMPINLVKSAVERNKMSTTSYQAKSNYVPYTHGYTFKMCATDRERPMYEVLYEHGASDLNTMIKTWGLRLTAMYTGVKKNDLIALKYHYGYHNPIPGDALAKATYFSNEVRKQVDERDNRQCVRCGYDLGVKDIRYHKISHPALCTADNCITLCLYCRKTRILPNYEIFNGMNYTTMKEWIHTHDPFQPKSNVTRRIYK